MRESTIGKESPNIILIIGNGFDLAHGIKTSFNDFAEYFINERIATELKELFRNKRDSNQFFNKKFRRDATDEMLIAHGENPIVREMLKYMRKDNNNGLRGYLNRVKDNLGVIIQNQFLCKLFQDSYDTWFDIENAYFYELYKIAKGIKDKDSIEQRKLARREVKELNFFLENIKDELINYLDEIKPEKSEEVESFVEELIENFNVKHPFYTYTINFNYTNTIINYRKISTDVNHIHGNLEKENIIFGYGNDQNDKYHEIKDLEIDEFLEHFKTFRYMQNNNYIKVYEEAIDKFDKYEVVVLGHSLGLTDKTLLEEIFTPDKCKKIHLFKRRDKEQNLDNVRAEFNKLLYSASRIMNNEKELRKKIVNFEDAQFFP